MSKPTSVIPKGSIILVTGLTGYIATHIAQQLFAGGYNVRGTVRDLSKASWLKDELFSTEHAAGKLELVQVPDLAAPEAFNEAVKGVSGVAHVATITSFDPDPNNVIPQTVEGVLSLLRAAAAQPSVRRVVYTSTAAAAVMPMPGVEGQIRRDSWNDAAVQAAWAPPPYEGSRALVTYIASKVEAEKAVWKFAKEQNPGFMVNVVSPFTTLGQALHSSHVRGTVGWVEQLWKGDTSQLVMLPAGKRVLKSCKVHQLRRFSNLCQCQGCRHFACRCPTGSASQRGKDPGLGYTLQLERCFGRFTTPISNPPFC